MVPSEALDLLERSCDKLSERRMTARKITIPTIRAIEKKIVDALSGERFRGMPNLHPRGTPLHAMRINAWSRHGAGGFLPDDGREVLVLTSEGKLSVACAAPHGLLVRPVLDDELLSEDLEAVTRVVQEAIEKHVALAEKRASNLSKIEDLARRINEALDLDIR